MDSPPLHLMREMDPVAETACISVTRWTVDNVRRIFVYWLLIHRSQVLFPVVSDFLRSGSGMGSTQPRKDNSGAT
jgi:hypothetical protein